MTSERVSGSDFKPRPAPDPRSLKGVRGKPLPISLPGDPGFEVPDSLGPPGALHETTSEKGHLKIAKMTTTGLQNGGKSGPKRVSEEVLEANPDKNVELAIYTLFAIL